MSQAPKQLPAARSPDFDAAMYEFWQATYLLWNNADKGSFVISEKTPATSSAAGSPGQMAWDTSYLYLCIQKNTWRRIAHATW